MVTSEIDWQQERIMIGIGGQETLYDFGKPAIKKPLAGYAEGKGDVVFLKFLDGTVEMVSKAEFKSIEEKWNILLMYQTGNGRGPEQGQQK